MALAQPLEKARLAQRYQDEIVPALVKVLSDDAQPPLVRRSAAVALGSLKEEAKSAQPALEKALSHDNPAVKQNAAATQRMDIHSLLNLELAA